MTKVFAGGLLRLGSVLALTTGLTVGINSGAVHADTATPVGSNLVTNGDFETTTGNVVAYNYGSWGEYTALTGWSVCPGNPGNTTYVEYGSNWLGSAHSPTHYVELNSAAPSDVCQTIATVPGQTYQLSFWYSARPGTPLADNQMNVSWAGAQLGTTISADGTGLSSTAWQEYTDTVTASSTSTTLEFTDVGQAVDSGCGACGSLLDDVSVQQLDTAPTVASVTVPSAPAAVGTTTNLSATFTDPDPADSRTATIDWGDGSTPTAGTVIDASGSTPGTVTGSHTYATDGVYTVTVTVTDAFGLSGSSVATSSVVIYDPSAGFVTGGGWLLSPAGAFAADPTLTGRANFGFVSKYQKGAQTPSGNTEFQFQAGSLSFHSTSYQWLVVGGDQAQYKGTGTINGQGTYGFLLTAQDAALSNGNLTADTFRMKIWDTTTGNTVYDNGAQSPISGGNIVIHSS